MNSRMRSCGVLFAALVSVVAVMGCGGKAYEGAERLPLTGKVVFDGQPVDGGTITFVPTIDKARPSGGTIVNGEYKVPEEKGANGGAYRVEIHWYKPTGKKIPDSDTGGLVDEVADVIPAKFNTQSTLTAEVSASKNQFDFDLTTK